MPPSPDHGATRCRDWWLGIISCRADSPSPVGPSLCLGPSPLGGRSRRTFRQVWADPPPMPSLSLSGWAWTRNLNHAPAHQVNLAAVSQCSAATPSPRASRRTGACTVFVILGSSSSGEPWPCRTWLRLLMIKFQSQCSINFFWFLLHESQQVPKLSISPRISQ